MKTIWTSGKEGVPLKTKAQIEREKKTNRLDKLIKNREVWTEHGTYFGRASDGIIVQLGVVGFEKQLEEYLSDYPDPTYW